MQFILAFKKPFMGSNKFKFPFISHTCIMYNIWAGWMHLSELCIIYDLLVLLHEKMKIIMSNNLTNCTEVSLSLPLCIYFSLVFIPFLNFKLIKIHGWLNEKERRKKLKHVWYVIHKINEINYLEVSNTKMLNKIIKTYKKILSLARGLSQTWN